jgi:hypothetical protein
VGISRDYPLKTRTSKQPTGKILGYKLIPSHPLKYLRSKQGLMQAKTINSNVCQYVLLPQLQRHRLLYALPAYAMGAMELPPALLRAIDALRRAFLWNFEGKASGAKCLISWEQVCRPKCEGGLGIRNLATQNMCLQVKLLHRLHSAPTSPWASWTWELLQGRAVPGKKRMSGPNWVHLEKLMPLSREISRDRRW